MFIIQQIICFTYMDHKKSIEVYIIFNYMFRFGSSRYMCLEQAQKMHLSGAGSAGSRKVVLRT